jgi:hypothetical protein
MRPATGDAPVGPRSPRGSFPLAGVGDLTTVPPSFLSRAPIKSGHTIANEYRTPRLSLTVYHRRAEVSFLFLSLLGQAKAHLYIFPPLLSYLTFQAGLRKHEEVRFRCRRRSPLRR